MKFHLALVGILAATASNVAAFSPRNFCATPGKSQNFIANTPPPSILTSSPDRLSTSRSKPTMEEADVQNHPALWRPPAMKMAAGGAERAYGDEYYDGTFDKSKL